MPGHEPSPVDVSLLRREAETAMQGSDYAGARVKWTEILTHSPSHGEALYLRALCAIEMHDQQQALDDLEAALKVLSPFADLYYYQGIARYFLDDLGGAMTCLNQAIALDSGHAPSLKAAGQLLAQSGHLQEAKQHFDRLLVLSPCASAFSDRAFVQRGLGDVANALIDADRALALEPDMPQAWQNRAAALHDLNHLQEAIEAFRMAADLQPDDAEAAQQVCFISRVICQWASLKQDDAHLIRRLQRPGPLNLSPFGLIPIADVSAESFADVTRRSAAQRMGPALHMPPLVDPQRFRQRKQLRIGYLSADFYEHATVRLIAGVIEKHHRERFAIYCYSYGQVCDDGTRRMAAISDVFRHLPQATDEALARQIAADDIDILIDLKGPTQHMRPGITARRPAPVIVNWLGFPGSFGHPRLADYLIGDPVATPLDHAPLYSETLALLPHCYQPNDRRHAIADRPSRQQAGLPETGLVFGNFNQTYKIDPHLFALWMRLLGEVPGSVLWQLESHPTALANLRQEAASAGIDPARIIAAPKLEQAAHLARLRLVDLALDTYPCNGHTTTSDALWAGVPVITCMGETFASRVAASILHCHGLAELVTTTSADYFALARELALTPSRLEAVRLTIERQRLESPLFDTAKFARDLEEVYRRIWDQQRQGLRSPIVISGQSEGD